MLKTPGSVATNTARDVLISCKNDPLHCCCNLMVMLTNVQTLWSCRQEYSVISDLQMSEPCVGFCAPALRGGSLTIQQQADKTTCCGLK